jgi:hypothetical protein
MIIKREITALAAGGSVANVWSGSAFEYLRAPSFVSLGICSLTTFALKGLLSTFYIGANLIAEEFTVPNVDPAIFGLDHPQIANNFFIQAAGNGGDRVVSTVRNPTAGAITGTAILQVVPAGGGRR